MFIESVDELKHWQISIPAKPRDIAFTCTYIKTMFIPRKNADSKKLFALDETLRTKRRTGFVNADTQSPR